MQDEHKSISDFLAAFTRYDSSAVGVMVIRSREPNRVEQALHEYCARSPQGARPFRCWDLARNWRIADHATGSFKREEAGVVKALKAVLDVSAVTSPAPMDPRTVCMFSDLHAFLGAQPNPEIVSLLRYYAWELPARSGQRIILSVPETFNVPEELSHDIPVIDMALPDTAELETLIAKVFADDAEQRRGTPQTYPADEMRQLAVSAGGLTCLEAETAVCATLIDFRDQIPNIPFTSFNRRVMAAKADTIKASGLLEIMPEVALENVGGLDLLKEWAQARAVDRTPEALAFGVKRPRGVTLIGPPGTGKSLTASTFGAIFRIPAIKIHIGALFGGIVGQTEANVRRLCKDIEALGECVVFADEIDRTMGMNTVGGDGGITRRMIGTLLDFMQTNETGAFFCFAANRAEGIDSALVRKGRIDEVFGVNPPNTVERLEILRIHLRKAKQDPSKIKDLQAAAAESSGYVGAELESAVQRAVSAAFRKGAPVSGATILQELQTIKPLSQSFAEDFAAMEAWASKNAVPASSPDPSKPARKAPAATQADASGPARRRNMN
jgi:AAA+ superfamily predicted ATPase